MLLFLKFSSKSSNKENHNPDDLQEQINNDACTSLTVWRKSLLFSCKGFTVIGSDGNLVYRVDNYSGHPDQVILMDALGNPILTTCRQKTLRLVDDWLIYEGEVEDDYSSSKISSKKPVFCVKKRISFLQSNISVLAHVYRGGSKKRHSYVIEGSYTNRSCRVLDESRRVVAEIKKKQDVIGGVSFGLEVFVLNVRPGFDSGFAMAMVLLLDQMFS